MKSIILILIIAGIGGFVFWIFISKKIANKNSILNSNVNSRFGIIEEQQAPGNNSGLITNWP